MIDQMNMLSTGQWTVIVVLALLVAWIPFAVLFRDRKGDITIPPPSVMGVVAVFVLWGATWLLAWVIDGLVWLWNS